MPRARTSHNRRPCSPSDGRLDGYGIQPGLVYGEGPTRARSGAFKEDFGFSAGNVRDVQRGEGTVYATLMVKPEGREVILASLGRHAGDAGRVTSVSVLGSRGKPVWSQAADGLHATQPDSAESDIATVLRIGREDLRKFGSVPRPPILT